MPKTRFDKVDYKIAETLLKQAPKISKSIQLAVVDSDYWQKGVGWVGPKIVVGTPSTATTFQNEIERAFVSYPALEEVVSRHMAGVVGKEPSWNFGPRRVLASDETPTDEEQTQISAVHAALTPWWNTRGVHEILQAFTRDLLWARRSALRIYVPEGDAVERDAEGVASVRASSLEEALEAIYVEHPDPDCATVYTDPNTELQLGVLSYRKTNDKFEIVSENTYEISYRADSGETIIKQIDKGVGVEAKVNLGGRLPMSEVTRLEPFVTSSMEAQQKALNLALSILPRNLITSGFTERVFLNAQLPGRMVKDASTGQERFVPDPLPTGAGATTVVAGIKVEGADGTKSITNPEVHFREPVETAPTLNAINALYQGILRVAKQAHVLANSEAGDSGVSREQQRSDFGASLEMTAPCVNRIGQWLLDTVLAMAEAITGRPGEYTRLYRATMTCRIHTGPLSSEERQQNIVEAEKGFLSRVTAMERNGVLDTDNELALIQGQPGAELDTVRNQAEVYQMLVDAGIPQEQASQLVEFDEETQKAIALWVQESTDNPPPENDDPVPGLPSGQVADE